MINKILITGALGQIGSELCYNLKKIYGEKNVISSDLKKDNKRITERGIIIVTFPEIKKNTQKKKM